MNYHKGRNISFYLASIFVAMLTFFSVSVNAKAADGLEMKMVKCTDPSFSGQTGDDLISACLIKYLEGGLNSYVLKDGDTIEPGTVVVGIPSYTYSGEYTNVLNYNIALPIDSSSWELMTFSDSYFYSDPEMYPGKKAGLKWSYTWGAGATFEDDLLIITGSSGINKLPLAESMDLGFLFFKLKDNATPGKTLSVNFNDDYSDFSDFDGTVNYTHIPMNYVGRNIAVAGGVVSGDNTLKTLVVKGNNVSYPLNPTFVSGSKTPNEFHVVVPNGVSSIDITATVNDSDAVIASINKVIGENLDATNRSLSVGDNKFNVIVSALNGDQATYTIHVKRLNNNADLTNITFTNGISITGFQSNTISYTIHNVPYATKDTSITAHLSDSFASIKSGDGSWNLVNHGSSVNKRDIIVEAENCKSEYASVTGNTCTKKTYTINLNRIAPSNNSKLSSLTVDGVSVPDFNANTLEYTIAPVANNKASINVVGVVQDTGKAVIESGAGSQNISVGDNTISVVVKAEDGTKTTYKIHVRRKNNDATLSSLTVNSTPLGNLSPAFSSGFFGEYTYRYQAQVTSIQVSATVQDTVGATVSLTDTTLGAIGSAGSSSSASATYGVNTKTVAALVTAEDGTVKTYSIKFDRSKSSNNYLSSLTVDNKSVPNFNKETKSYNLTVLSNVSSVVVEGTPEDTIYGKVTKGNGSHSLQFGNNDIEVVVEAENKQTLSYFIHITREESNNATLSGLTVDGVSVPDFSPTKDSYTLDKVPFTKTNVNIAATLSDANANIISGTGNISLHTGNNALEVKVEAQDGTPKTYTINIERAKNQDASVKSVVVHGVNATLNEEGQYEVTLANNVSVLTPSDVVIGISGDAAITKPQTNMNLSTTSVNHYNFSVTAEDTTVVKPYEILITREKSNDASIGTVTLDLGDGVTKSCTMSGTNCNIEVPVNTTGFNLTASISNVASIIPLNGTYHAMGNTESTKEITLVVKAEDETEKTYVVRVQRQKSSDNDLSSLSVNGSLIEDFRADQQTYDIRVPGLTSEVTINALVHDTGKATITTDLSQPFPLEFGSGNRILVVVRAENGQPKTYTINITREKGIDATLKDLTINGETIPDFDPSEEDYTLDSVDYNTIAQNVGATPNDSLATASGTGNISLHTGDNIIKVLVTAHDGVHTKEYRIHVNRAQNKDAGIKGITVAGIEAVHSSGNNYTVTVPNSVKKADSGNVIVRVNDPKVSTDPIATYAVTETNLDTKNPNNVEVVVTSEYGNTETYNVVVTREKSNVATLDTLTVTNGSFSPSFNKDKFTYTVVVPVNTTAFDVAATLTDSTATINSGVGHYDMVESEKTVEVVVVSEDEDVTKKYVLHIERTKSSVNTLSSLTVSHDGENYTLTPDFTSEQTLYTLNVAGDVDQVDVAALLTDTRATIESGLGNHSLNVGANTIRVRVRSESGSPIDYTITINRAKKSYAELTDLTIDNVTIPGFDPKIYEYTITSFYPYSTTSVMIGASLFDSDASVSGIGRKGLDTGNNTFVVEVTAQDGTTKQPYTIHLTREKNNDSSLSILSVNGGIRLSPSFDPEIIDYEITVPETKSELSALDITALANDTNAAVVKGDTISLSTTKDNYYTVLVTAEDGVSHTIYTIKVNRPKSTDATLKDVVLNGASLTPTFNSSTDTYTLNVPYGATSYDIEGVPNVDTTVVSGNGTYQVSEYSTITLTTMAEAGSEHTKTYTFHVVEALSNDATLASLSVPGYPFKEPNTSFSSAVTTYDIGNIPYGITEVLVNAVPTNATSTLEYYVGATKLESNQINIPQVVGSNSITVKVTAPDGIATKSYIISYRIVLSDNAYLSQLQPSVGSLAFNKTTYGYELNVSNEVNSIDFDITTEDNNARITVNGTSYPTPKKITLNDLAVGNTTLQVLVTAQNGVAKNTYDVVIKKAAPVASNDATLSSLEVENYSFATTFDPDNLEYTIGTIPYSLDTLTIRATAKVGASKIKYLVNGVAQSSNVVTVPKQNGNGEIVVQVTAEDGTTVNNYKITYSKTANNDAYLSNINISEGSISFDSTKQNYTIDVDADVNSVDVTSITKDEHATITINGVKHSSPHTTTISPLNTGANTLNIIVTAEDGTTSLTYTLVFNKSSKVNEHITSEAFGHTIDSGYIKTVGLNTTSSELKDQLDNPNEHLEIWTADDTTKVSDGDKLATGMIVKLIINGSEKDRQLIVIKGDTSGDGEINLFDAVPILNHYIDIVYLTGPYLEAAYVSDDTDLNLFDAVAILNHYLNIESIY